MLSQVFFFFLIHWHHWDALCMAKFDRGLGFKDFESFNLALLASQWWRMMSRPDNLVYKVLKAKYFPNVDPIKDQLPANSSYLWRSLFIGRAVVEKGCLWRVRNGSSMDVWFDGVPHNRCLSQLSWRHETKDGITSLLATFLMMSQSFYLRGPNK